MREARVEIRWRRIFRRRIVDQHQIEVGILGKLAPAKFAERKHGEAAGLRPVLTLNFLQRRVRHRHDAGFGEIGIGGAGLLGRGGLVENLHRDAERFFAMEATGAVELGFETVGIAEPIAQFG